MQLGATVFAVVSVLYIFCIVLFFCSFGSGKEGSGGGGGRRSGRWWERRAFTEVLSQGENITHFQESKPALDI